MCRCFGLVVCGRLRCQQYLCSRRGGRHIPCLEKYYRPFIEQPIVEIHRSELPRFLDPHAAFLDLRLVGCKDKHELGEIVSSQVEKLAGMVVEIRDGEIGEIGEEIGVNASGG